MRTGCTLLALMLRASVQAPPRRRRRSRASRATFCGT